MNSINFFCRQCGRRSVTEGRIDKPYRIEYICLCGNEIRCSMTKSYSEPPRGWGLVMTGHWKELKDRRWNRSDKPG